jgi:wobble nucleotide-excising tRNase
MNTPQSGGHPRDKVDKMIKKIEIGNFGIFSNFSWDSTLPEFKKHNLIYGWNYSGKSTFARILRCYEINKRHEDYEDAIFSIVDDTGTIIGSTGEDLKKLINIKVFCTDFVRDNLAQLVDPNTQNEPILILGEENVILQKELDDKKQQLIVLNDAQSQLKNNKIQFEVNIDNKLSEKAREVKNTLSIPDFNREKLKPYVETSKSDIPIRLLFDSEFNNELAKYRVVEKKDKINIMSMPKLILKDLLINVNNIMKKNISTSNIISELVNDEILNQWVKQGKTLHQGKDNCLFCGSLLPLDLLERLDHHYSDEYKQLETEIDLLIKQIATHQTELNQILLPTKGDLYTESSGKYENIKKEYLFESTEYIEILNNLVIHLDQKKSKPYDIYNMVTYSENSLRCESIYNELLEIFKIHNLKTDNFEKERESAKQKLLYHFAAQFASENHYEDNLKQINIMESLIAKNNNTLELLQLRITELNKQLSESVRGANLVNKYLNLLFRNENIKIEVTFNNKYRILRNEKPAKNLSEGEKTAISFSYFLTKLDEKGVDLNQTIVCIDDPISSLDNNHLFNIYALIKTKLDNCGQIFILTHNLDFFNLMKDYLHDISKPNGKPLYSDDNLPCYLIQRLWNSTNDCSRIYPLPYQLKKFRSEYVYLFNLLKRFHDSPDFQNYDMLYIIPNIIRRFLENYCGIHYPDGKPAFTKYDKIFPNPAHIQKIHKFINLYSHNSSAERAFRFPDSSECKEINDILFESIKFHDNGHFESLCESCNQ